MPTDLSSCLVREPVGVELQRRVNALRDIDNATNWLYLAREYLFLGLVMGLTITLYHYQGEGSLSWVWTTLVTFAAVVLIGAAQHRLVILGHEGSHYVLFRNRLLNEVASDWFCMFPVLSTTHQFRRQHMGHHQYVNDPERDPDVAQMAASGHRFRFPLSQRRFVWECMIKQFLWLPNLARYIAVRARSAALGSGPAPQDAERPPRSPLLRAGGPLYLATLAATLIGLGFRGDPWLLAMVPAGMWVSSVTFFALLPERFFGKSSIKPDVPARWTAILRVTHLTLVFTTLAWLKYLTGQPWGLYYVLLWVVPLGTTFAFFMLLRQVVQHGNAGRDRLNNTRVFHVAWPIRLAVFPLGEDYHLPHHLFPMVPHYRLKQLHALLQETQAYREQATVAQGYFFNPQVPPAHPTVLDLIARP